MKVHQNVVLDGCDIGERSVLRDSKFCNEGKWENFIAPLLPEDCSELTFVEIGCNAGLFLQLATERGFQRVVGVDSDENAYRAAIAYRDSLSLSYRVVNAEVGEQFDFALMPAADVTLMANVHYHMTIPQFVYVLDRLAYKTRYCIIVSIHRPRGLLWRAARDMAAVRGYFSDWQEIGTALGPNPEGDPHPRPMYSIAFASKIERVSVEGVRALQGNHPTDAKIAKDFIGNCLYQKGELESTGYYLRELKKETDKHNPHANDVVLKRVQAKRDLICSIRDNGMTEPILIGLGGKLLDGVHRLLTAEV
ncbi:MAG: hypothetical protein ABIH46_09610, partial [Chloroflexota bacterium]